MIRFAGRPLAIMQNLPALEILSQFTWIGALRSSIRIRQMNDRNDHPARRNSDLHVRNQIALQIVAIQNQIEPLRWNFEFSALQIGNASIDLQSALVGPCL